jgi:type II secretory pathway component GspD/PulD (secretin)
VLIEAKILEVSLTDEMTLGVNWEKVLGDATIGTGGFSSGILPESAPASPVPSTGLGFFGNVITGAGTSHQFRAALDALRGKTRIDTLSTPKILAIHGKAARVQVGGQQGYRVTTTNLGVATETIEFIDTGTILEITPYIDDKDNILLNVKPTINTAKIEEGIPVVNSTVVSTWLLAGNGETVLIGGLIQEEAVETQTAIPCLGSIPGLGYLFGRKSHGAGKSELVVLITPTVLHDGNPEVPDAMEKTRQSQRRIQRQKNYTQPWRWLENNADPAYGGQDHE